jgi:hypothetical protein
MEIQVNRFTLNDATPTLVFSGTGKIKLSMSGAGGMAIGGSSVTFATGALDLSGFVVELSAPTDVYAIASSGASPVCCVSNWY